MSSHSPQDDANLQAWIIRQAAFELRLDALEAWQFKHEPIVDALRDADMIARAIADKTAQSLTNRWTKRHYAVAVAAIFIPPLLSALLVALTVHIGGH